ncbi:MAG TPA: hypothetical protein RMF84_06690 [Polyangiaceae bacterium LLY-WYZ-14_1]|nr:hypothetical protein [Polyangiaceae bacterium LLY-WYZ-14_1]
MTEQSAATTPQAASGTSDDEVYVNVEMPAPMEQKVVAENKAWNANKLVALTLVTLVIALIALYAATVWTGTWGRTIDYPNFLAPESDTPYKAEPAHR